MSRKILSIDLGKGPTGYNACYVAGIRGYRYMIDKEHKQRTIQQNKALHLFCGQYAEALNDAGLDMKRTLKPEIDIPWTPENVKNHLFKPILEALTGKSSTADMDTVDPSKVCDIINRFMAEKYGISVEWPNRS